MSGEHHGMDPVVAAMVSQLEIQATFRANAPQDVMNSSPSTNKGCEQLATSSSTNTLASSLLAQAQQQGAMASDLAGLLQQHAQQHPTLTTPRQHLQPRINVSQQSQQLQQQQQIYMQLQRQQSSSIGSTARADASSSAAHRAFSAAQEEKVRMQKLKEENAKREEDEAKEAEKLRCHLHKRPKDSCKFCRKWLDFVNKGKEDRAALKEKMLHEGSASRRNSDDSNGGLLEVMNSKTFGLPPLLQSHIVESQHFKALMSFDDFDQMVEEIFTFADTVEPYMTNSTTIPSALFCCLYRLFTLGLDGDQLRALINSSVSPFVRCIGFLFVRFGLAPDMLWPWLGEYVLDDEELRPSKDSEWATTIGEYVEGLLSKDRYYSTVLPRLPMTTKRQVESKLAQVPQYRKRTQANQRLLEVYRQRDVRIEACPDDLAWQSGVTVSLDESSATRQKVRVRLSDGREEVVHIGKIILTDHRFSSANGHHRGHRTRSRSRSPQVDWARYRGKSQAELIDAQRSRDRDKAVCSSGKDYARKPVGFKVACALPREMGAASHRLMEDETFVPIRRDTRRRSPSPAQEKKVQHSAEHQAQMQQLFEKYGMAKAADTPTGTNLIEGPDVMRLG